MPDRLYLEISECNNSFISHDTIMCNIFTLWLFYCFHSQSSCYAKRALVRHHTWRHFDSHTLVENCSLFSLCWSSYCMTETDWSSEAMPSVEDLFSSASHFHSYGSLDAVW